MYCGGAVAHARLALTPLQDRKTELLKDAPKSRSTRKSFSSKIRFDPTKLELEAFAAIQAALSRPTFLAHFDINRVLFVDLDSSKEAGIGAMVYYTKGFMPEKLTTLSKSSTEGQSLVYPIRNNIEPILFLSRIINGTELRY